MKAMGLSTVAEELLAIANGEDTLPQVGTVVVSVADTAICKKGEVGLVYERYNMGHEGISVIFERGGYDGFSNEERQNMLVILPAVSSELNQYEFRNVIQLQRDYEDGIFAEAFKVGKTFCEILRDLD